MPSGFPRSSSMRCVRLGQTENDQLRTPPPGRRDAIERQRYGWILAPPTEGAYDDDVARPLVTDISLVLAGVALGVAATLLITSKAGDGLVTGIAARTAGWKARLADVIVQGRENAIRDVENSRNP